MTEGLFLNRFLGFAGFVGKRLLHVIPTMLLIVAVNFFLLQAAPGDAVDVLASESGGASKEVTDLLRQQFGLDQSVGMQFLHYLQNMLSFNLGYSLSYNDYVTHVVLARIPATLLLMLPSILLALAIGVTLGVVAAVWRGKWIDNVINVISVCGFAMPLFWLALLLVIVFSLTLKWLPASGMYDIYKSPKGMAYVLDVAKHMVLPMVSLAFYYLAIFSRITRSAMIEVSGQDFIRFARAKGLRKGRITIRHTLRNALLPVVTMTGLQLGAMLGGSVVIETIFAWPGMGRLAFEAIFRRDLNLLLGILFLSSFLVIVANIVTDMVYAAIDPRIDLK